MKILNSKTKNLLLATCFLFMSTLCLGQQEAYESPAGTKFLLYTPPAYSSSMTSNFPLLLSLHSKGEVGDDLTELTSRNPEQMPCRLIYLNRWPADLPFIVLTPQLKPDPNDPEIQWSAAYIDEVVNYVIQNFRIDLSRIYVTGISTKKLQRFYQCRGDRT
jgi:predicted peptidase